MWIGGYSQTLTSCVHCTHHGNTTGCSLSAAPSRRAVWFGFAGLQRESRAHHLGRINTLFPMAHANIVPTIFVLETPSDTAPRLLLYAMEYDCSRHLHRFGILPTSLSGTSLLCSPFPDDSVEISKGHLETLFCLETLPRELLMASGNGGDCLFPNFHPCRSALCPRSWP